MAKWGSNNINTTGVEKERWEYAQFVYNWKQGVMDVGNNKRLHWPQVWELFNEMGNDGWEMVTASSVSTAMMGHAAGDTNHMLFIMKRRK